MVCESLASFSSRYRNACLWGIFVVVEQTMLLLNDATGNAGMPDLLWTAGYAQPSSAAHSGQASIVA
jgi:hypothetical protein